MAKKKEPVLISLRDYALNHNPHLNRRGFKMSEGYLYRLIRDHNNGKIKPELWFSYKFEGDKNRILIEL